MTMISRRTLTGLTIGAIAVTAAGCGRGSDEPGSSSAPSTLAEGKATGDLTVWAMGAEGEELQALAEGFTEDNPDATIEVTAVPWDAAHDKIATSIAGGETPDITQVGSTWMGEFAGTGALDPTLADGIAAVRAMAAAGIEGIDAATWAGLPATAAALPAPITSRRRTSLKYIQTSDTQVTP